MLNQENQRRTQGSAPVQILANVELQFSMGIVLSSTGTEEIRDGRKYIAAGTPLTGDLNNRTTPFHTATGEDKVTGVLLHDVDVTDKTKGSVNATILLWGFVNTNRLSTPAKALITDQVKEDLNAKVTFISC